MERLHFSVSLTLLLLVLGRLCAPAGLQPTSLEYSSEGTLEQSSVWHEILP